MRIVLLDDCRFPWEGVEISSSSGAIQADDLDRWFWHWARDGMNAGTLLGDGLFLIHAHGRFTPSAHAQDLQGVGLLKHIRLTPWLGSARTWHAIVYSFEPLEDILARKPGDLILKSQGVTFLRLPTVLSLRNALVRAHPERPWGSADLTEILRELAATGKAAPTDRSFRPYVASDYSPPDSAHQLSNWWGIYEMFLAFSKVEHPEYTKPELLPPGVQEFVLRLDTKKARWLDGSRGPSAAPQERQPEFNSALEHLTQAARGKRIIYVDDEAGKGWSDLLQNLVNQDPGRPSCTIMVPDARQLQLADKERHLDAYGQQVNELARWINSNEPALLILDLRLLGGREAYVNPTEASGMDLARAVRTCNRYVPILLFTASNKAETLLISRSLDIDDYWMKPGLGEHRGLRSREEDLLALTQKLKLVLGRDYSWLQRVGCEIGVTRQSPRKQWWERTVKWPGPSEGYPADQLDVHKPKTDVREEVLRYIDSILYTARMIFRMQNALRMPATVDSGGSSPQFSVPDSVPERLCAALFNQIGQVVELVHGVSEADGDPFGSKTGNARMGGYYDRDKKIFVFRRCDWWAFYLFAWRNNFSHPGAVARFEDVKQAASDLIAWLTCARAERRLLTKQLREDVAERMLNSPLRDDGSTYPVLRLLKNEKDGRMRVTGKSISCVNPGGQLAQDNRFREQLAMRPEFSLLIEKSRELLDGS
jgi:CheY-like chemotaxis protein